MGSVGSSGGRGSPRDVRRSQLRPDIGRDFAHRAGENGLSVLIFGMSFNRPVSDFEKTLPATKAEGLAVSMYRFDQNVQGNADFINIGRGPSR